MASSHHPYSKRAFLPNLVLYLFASLSVLLIVLSTPVDPLLGALIMLLLLSVTLLLGASPFLTDHELHDDRLVLRQGWYFRAVIPLDNIADARMVEAGPRKIGVSFRMNGPVIGVTTRKRQFIEIRLRTPQRFAWAWGKRADRVFFDTVDDQRLVERLRR
jgi:hypothetical protein